MNESMDKIRQGKINKLLYGSIVYRIVRKAVIAYLKAEHDMGIRAAGKKIKKLAKSHPDNKEIQEINDYLKSNPLDVFPYDFVGKYDEVMVQAYLDDEGYPYVIHSGKKLYGPLGTTADEFARYYTNIREEQDVDSPHCYVPKPGRSPRRGSIIAELGAAEALFTLEYVESIDGAYLFECEDKWMIPLAKTFEPWKDKVTIVRKYVGGVDTDEFITLDTFFADKNVTVVKADIEGAEVDMLRGGEKTFRRKIKQAYICTYHKWDDEQNIKRILKEYGFSTEVNKRYMMVHYSPKDFRKKILRRGVIRGTK